VSLSAPSDEQADIIRNRKRERAEALSLALCLRCVDLPPCRVLPSPRCEAVSSARRNFVGDGTRHNEEKARWSLVKRLSANHRSRVGSRQTRETSRVESDTSYKNGVCVCLRPYTFLNARRQRLRRASHIFRGHSLFVWPQGRHLLFEWLPYVPGPIVRHYRR
jgi:hypothetical protein